DKRPYGEVGGGLLGGLLGSRAYNKATRPGEVDTARKAVKQRKEAAYKAVDTSQERVSKQSVRRFVDDVKGKLRRSGYVDSAPEYASITRKLDELANKPSADLTPAGFDAYMKGLD